MGTWYSSYIYRDSLQLVELNERIMAARQPTERGRHNPLRKPCGTPAARRRHREKHENCAVCGYTWAPHGKHARKEMAW